VVQFALPADEYSPAEHGMQEVNPAEFRVDVPALHCAQEVKPDLAAMYPSGQSLHDVAPYVDEYCPVGHKVQDDICDVEP